MRALITGAAGDIQRFFYHSRPTMQRYAERHGYALRDGPWDTRGRHPYWMKLAAILDQWNHYDELLWLDADIIVTADAPDVFEEIPDDRWLGIVEAPSNEGRHPNVGVMAIRTTDEAFLFLSRCWRMHAKYHRHKWPDQAPVMELLGYSTTLPVMRLGDTEYTDSVQMLGNEWNALPRFGESGHFLHFAGVPVDVRLDMLHRLMAGAHR